MQERAVRRSLFGAELGPEWAPAGGNSKCKGPGEGLNLLEEHKQSRFGEGKGVRRSG